MAHFAKIGTDNIVTNVIVVNNEDILDENNVEQEALGIALYTTYITMILLYGYRLHTTITLEKTMLVLDILMMKQEMLFMPLNLTLLGH